MFNVKTMTLAACFAAGVFSLAACSNNAAKTETTDVKQMDSVSTDLETLNKELEAKTASLEKSLEKLESEVDTAKK